MSLRTTHVDAGQRGRKSEDSRLPPEMKLPGAAVTGALGNFLIQSLFEDCRDYILSIHSLPSLVTSPGLLLPWVTSLSAEQLEIQAAHRRGAALNQRCALSQVSKPRAQGCVQKRETDLPVCFPARSETLPGIELLKGLAWNQHSLLRNGEVSRAAVSSPQSRSSP